VTGAGDEALLEGARLEGGDDVLVLGGGPLVFGAHERIGDGWVYVVRSQVDELEGLLQEAHGNGAAGVAYLVGEAPVLPLPDAAVTAVVGRVAVDAAALATVAGELLRVLRPGGRVALGEPDTDGAQELRSALAAVGFVDAEAAAEGGGALVTARRP
jgi:ubiquinone/menaquinone biosynthesis C-methylase UbiE